MAMSFDGVDDSVDWGDVNALDGLAKLTVSAMIKVRTGSAGFGYAVSKATEVPDPLNGWSLLSGALNTTAYVFARNAGLGDGSVASAITLDTFMHWLYVYDGAGAANADRLKLYLNGTQQTLDFGATTIPATIGAHAQTMLYGGNRNGAFGSHDIAEVGIWPGVAITTPGIIAGLAAGQCPLFYADQGLRFCDHGQFTSGAPVVDVLQLASATVTGATFATHPPTTHPWRGRALPNDGAGVPGRFAMVR